MNRRRFLTGSAGLLLAPAIVRVSSLMPVSVLPGSVTVVDLAWAQEQVRRYGCSPAADGAGYLGIAENAHFLRFLRSMSSLLETD